MAMAIVRESEQGTLEQLLVTPMHSWELLLSKILPYIIVGYIQVIVSIIVGMSIFGVTLFRKQDPFLHPDLVLCGCQPLARYNDFDIFTKPDAGSAAFDIFNTAECTAFREFVFPPKLCPVVFAILASAYR